MGVGGDGSLGNAVVGDSESPLGDLEVANETITSIVGDLDFLNGVALDPLLVVGVVESVILGDFGLEALRELSVWAQRECRVRKAAGLRSSRRQRCS